MTGRALQLSALLVLSARAARAGARAGAAVGVGAGARAGAGVGAGAAFPESRLISPAQGAQLNSWANQLTDRKWALCYTSFTMGKTAAEFHKRCDQYKPTFTVAHNSLNHTFGGFVRLSFHSQPKLISQDISFYSR